MRLDISGCELNVELLGGEESTKPLLIGHHGAPGLGSMAEPTAAFGFLADTFRVIVFDARGSGRSADVPPFTHLQWVSDIDALREWAGAEQFVMAGGSYGGFLSMEYAVAHPERLLALVLRDTAADSGHDELALTNARESDRVDIPEERLQRMFKGEVRDNEDFKDLWRELLPLYAHTPDPTAVEEQVEATPYHYATHNAAFSVARTTYDVKPQLHKVTCPTLVVVGRSDWITPVSNSEEIHGLIPQSELEIFEKSGHSPPLEEPGKYQQVLRDFLNRALANGIGS